MNQRFCLALDLKNDEAMIAAYKEQHRHVWPEIIKSIKESGVTVFDMYCTGNRLFVILEVNEKFSFEEKAKADAESEIVQQWEELMWKYQQPLPWVPTGEKWAIMEKIFELD